MRPGWAAIVLVLAAGLSVGARQLPTRVASVNRSSFGTTADGAVVDLFTLVNAHGLEIRAIGYGAIIVSLRTSDRRGRLDDIVLGFDSLGDYLDREDQ